MITTETLVKIGLFEGLSDKTLASIAALCREESFPSDTVICAEGHKANRIYFLQDGTVGLLVKPTSLPKPLTLSVLKSPGQAFGWSAVVGQGYYTAQGRALSDVRVISIDGHGLLDYLEQNPVVGFVVMKRVAEIVSCRLRITRTLVLETAFD